MSQIVDARNKYIDQLLTEINRLKAENENLYLLIDFMEGRGRETQEEITRIRSKIAMEATKA